MFKPQGVITPILTTFNEKDESFNEVEFRNQVERLIAAGIDGIFALGTNGEFYALNYDEKIEVIKTAVDAVKGRVPVYAGTGYVTTQETIKLTQEAEKLGVDAVSVITPYFVAASQEDIYNHFKAVADSVKLPIILYNIPARTGNSIDYKTAARLANDCENVIGIKDSSGNFDNTLKYIENTGGKLSVLAGSDSLILWTLLAGGTGAISGCSNVFPELMSKIYDEFAAGNFEAANEAQKKIRPFRNVMQMGNPNSVVKFAVNLLGHPVGPCREPGNCTDEKIKTALLEVFNEYK